MDRHPWQRRACSRDGSELSGYALQRHKALGDVEWGEPEGLGAPALIASKRSHPKRTF